MKLEVINGSFRYGNTEKAILDNINFSLESGDVMAVLGPNGAGKTTLLRAATGFLKWEKGVTLLDGKKLSEIPQKRLWKKISYVPQASEGASSLTAEEMILLGRASMVNAFCVPGRADMAAADRCIKKTGLENIRKRPCNKLSGGELQMVLIARALAAEPEIIILDEPESNLDFKNQLRVLDMISELSAEGKICIFNTHYPAHALRRGTRALMLGKDGCCRFGPVSEIVTEDNIEKCFGVKALVGEIKRGDFSFPDIVPVSVCDGQQPAERFT